MKYVAFLRAINVGKRQMKMVDLKRMFEDLGFKNVKTFIASGNVIFESEEENKKVLAEKIENEIEKSFGFKSETMLRTHDELKELTNINPFKNISLDKNIILYVGFLYDELNQESIKKIEELSNEVDILKVINKELFVLRYKDRGESVMSTSILGKYIKTFITVRNWNTIVKIAAL